MNKLRDGLSHIESRGGTALYDAVVASADKLVADAKRPKQVLIIITDGEDNASTLTLEQTIRRVQQLSGPVIYSIGLLFGDEMTHSEVRHARRALEMLSGETGGIAFFPKSIEQVDEIAAEVARDIRNQYTIGYHSTKPTNEPGFRRVQVTAQAQGMGKLEVRTRTGYFPAARVPKKTKGASQQVGRLDRWTNPACYAIDWFSMTVAATTSLDLPALLPTSPNLWGTRPCCNWRRLCRSRARRCLPSSSF